MRLLRVTTLYPEYLAAFYAARPGLDREPYDVQRARLDEDFFGWADSWKRALEPLGWETRDLAINAGPLQRAWAAEHLARGASRAPGAIAVEQARAFRPDVLWYDHDDAVLLRAIREAASGIRGVAGWVGSAIGRREAWSGIDLMLSCAPEAVERCEREGLRAAVLAHAFDPRVLDRLRPREPRYDVTFIGQLIDAEGFHRQRIQILGQAAARTSLTLFVPRPRRSWRSRVRRLLTGVGSGPPLPGLRPEQVYGLAMYQVLRDSRATLNIHADSSPRFASNMRLFEATGVGSCLVTDGKENLATLFEPDREVVAYRSGPELVDALRRLAGDPDSARVIAEAGQRRTLASHTFAHRAPLLDEHLRKMVR
jgi:spore maturation protein CgeB